MNKLKFFIFVGIIALISLKYGSDIKEYYGRFAINSISTYLSYKDYIKNRVDEHFAKVEELKKLKEENEKLKVSKELLNAFSQGFIKEKF